MTKQIKEIQSAGIMIKKIIFDDDSYTYEVESKPIGTPINDMEFLFLIEQHLKEVRKNIESKLRFNQHP